MRLFEGPGTVSSLKGANSWKIKKLRRKNIFSEMGGKKQTRGKCSYLNPIWPFHALKGSRESAGEENSFENHQPQQVRKAKARNQFIVAKTARNIPRGEDC